MKTWNFWSYVQIRSSKFCRGERMRIGDVLFRGRIFDVKRKFQTLRFVHFFLLINYNSNTHSCEDVRSLLLVFSTHSQPSDQRCSQCFKCFFFFFASSAHVASAKKGRAAQRWMKLNAPRDCRMVRQLARKLWTQLNINLDRADERPPPPRGIGSRLHKELRPGAEN